MLRSLLVDKKKKNSQLIARRFLAFHCSGVMIVLESSGAVKESSGGCFVISLAVLEIFTCCKI